MLRIGPIMINLRQVVRVHHNHILLKCYQHLQCRSELRDSTIHHELDRDMRLGQDENIIKTL